MTLFRHAVFGAMIPVNLVMILWVWLGRGLFGATLGWIALYMLFIGAPILLAALASSTVLAYQQPGRPQLSTAAAWTQVALWLIMAALGVVIFDVDDASPEESILLNVIGWSGDNLNLSANLTAGLAYAMAACWLTLMVLLVRGRRRTAPPPDL